MKDHLFSVSSEFEKQLPYYLVGIGSNYEQESISRPFGYPYFQWINTNKGTGVIEIKEKKTQVSKGQTIILFPEDSHNYCSLNKSEDPWMVSWFTFGGYHIENLLKTVGIEESGIYNFSGSDQFNAKINHGYSLLSSDRYMKGIDLSALVYEFILDMYKYIVKDEGKSDHQYTRFNKVLSYIDNNYNKTLDIAELAEIINVSPQHFCQLFKKRIHLRPFEYINQRRIDMSKTLLISCTDRKIGDISKTVGFESVSYFSSMFKKAEGISPGNFRQLNRLT